MRQDRTGRALPFVILRRAERDRGTQRRHEGESPWAALGAKIAYGAAGSPGLRREDAACRRMTKEVARAVRVDELKRLGPFAQEAVDEGGLPGTVRTGEEDEGGHGSAHASEPVFDGKIKSIDLIL